MEPVRVGRPYMPGYGTLGAGEGTGPMPWSWAEERMAASHDYWLGTVTAPALPHLMPVWAVLLDGALWFSCSNGSRKTRNLTARPYASLATADPQEPVVAEGPVDRVTARADLERMLAAENAKYRTDYGIDMLDPAENTCWALTPDRVFGLDAADFTGSPTGWDFR